MSPVASHGRPSTAVESLGQGQMEEEDEVSRRGLLACLTILPFLPACQIL